MIRLTKKQILLLHSQLIRIYGGSDGIEPVLLTADDDASGFLTTVRNTGIAV